MFFDLQIDDCTQKMQYRKVLFKKKYSIGRSIKNDVVILDKNIPLFWKTVKREGIKYTIEDEVKFSQNKSQFLIALDYSRYFYGLCVVGAAGIAYILYNIFYVMSSQPLHEIPIFLPVKSAYGVLTDKDQAKQDIKFYFHQTDLAAVKDRQLNFSVGNIDDSDLVSVFVNKKFIGYAQASGSGSWGKEQSLPVAKDILNKEKNEILFKLQRQHSHEKKWGLRNIYLEQTMKVKEHDLDTVAITKYLQDFLKLPEPDEEDYKRVNVIRLKYNQLKTKKSRAIGLESLETMFQEIKAREEQFFKSKALEKIRHDQLQTYHKSNDLEDE